jgi:hypothetical protein
MVGHVPVRARPYGPVGVWVWVGQVVQLNLPNPYAILLIHPSHQQNPMNPGIIVIFELNFLQSDTDL